MISIKNNSISKYKSKAELNRAVHIFIVKKYNNINIFMTILILLITAIISVIAFANIEFLTYSIQLMISILSLTVFLLTIISIFFNFRESLVLHSKASDLWTKFIRECNDIEENSGLVGPDLIEKIRCRYTDIIEMGPKTIIKDRDFLRIKKSLRLKIKCSKEIDGDPEIDITNVFKELKRNGDL